MTDTLEEVITPRPQKPLLVGELNPYDTDPYYALYPRPRYASGNRLRLLMRQSDVEYLSKNNRVDLCAGKWSVPAARERAREVVEEFSPSVIVLLGSKVCKAFGVPYVPFSHPEHSEIDVPLVVLPHPSGRNPAWRAPEASDRAYAALTVAGAVIGRGDS